jgi:hypothetical protein
MVSSIGKNLAGEAAKGNILGRIKDTIDRGAAARKAEQDKEWNDSWVGKILPNPTKLFGGAKGTAFPSNPSSLPKGYHQMPDGRIMKDSDHMNGKGNELGQFYRGEIDGDELVRRLGESVADFRRRVAEGPRRRRERRAAQEAHDNEQRARVAERGRYDELATRLLACVDDRADLAEISRIRRDYMAHYGFEPRPSEVWGQLLNFGTNSDSYPRLAGPQAEAWLRRNNC